MTQGRNTVRLSGDIMTEKQRLQMLMLCKVNRALVRLNTILDGNGLADSETKRIVQDASRVLRIVGHRIIRNERMTDKN